MGSSFPSAADFSPEFAAAFRARAGGRGTLPFADFMALALYAPGLGFYRGNRARVGLRPEADFFTSATSNPVFAELVLAAVGTLLGGEKLSGYVFVEIGAEPEQNLFAGTTHPFAQARAIRVGEPLEISGATILFSNELFDAQPFRRFQFRAGAWRELGVGLSSSGFFETEVAGEIPADVQAVAAREGYVIDYPDRSAALLETIARQPWRGLFLAFDYGKAWAEIISELPAGTARAYSHHRQSNELLRQPGAQDLTCHICWDWLVSGLASTGFSEINLESQEAFFIHRAGAKIAEISSAHAANFARRKLSLLQLLHPANSGQKFQVLHARRI